MSTVNIHKWVEDIVERELQEKAREIQHEMVYQINSNRNPDNIHTGHLARSVQIERLSNHTYFIGPTLEYAKWYDDGRNAIKVPNARHPGTKAMKFSTTKGTFVRSAVGGYGGSHFVKKTASKFK